MCPALNELLPQRKLRSRSVSTPKKTATSGLDYVDPKSETKTRGRPKIILKIDKLKIDKALHNVAPKGSPIKKKPIQQNSPKKIQNKVKQSLFDSSPKKNVKSYSENVDPNKSETKSRRPKTPLKIDKTLQNVAKSPLKAKNSSPLKQLQLNSPIKSPLKSLQLNSPSKKVQNKAKQALFDTESPSRKLLGLNRPNLSRMSEARNVLSSGLPDEICGREKQIDSIREFLDNNLGTEQEVQKSKPGSKKSKKASSKKNCKRSIYISGPPGTGKTTCLKRLFNEIPQGQTKTIFVNCMSLGHSGDIFTKIADAICPQKSYSNSMEAERVIREWITVYAKSKILLVLDEIDQLDSKDQEILYTVFEWPHLENSKLVLVGIANSLDLTDRILPRLRIRSELHPQELSFPAYKKAEIIQILESRLTGFIEPAENPLFRSNALVFLAGKISSNSGDIRKALDICRRAIELEETKVKRQSVLSSTPGKPTPIGIPQILKLVNDIYCSAISQGTADDLPLEQKLLLCTMLLMTKHRKAKEITLGKLHETYTKVCKKRNMKPYDIGQALTSCESLESKSILRVKNGGKAAKDKKLDLRIDDTEVTNILKDKTLLSGILNDIDCLAK